MERRRHARIAQRAVSDIPVAFSGEAKGTGTLYDLSPGGCKVGCTNPPPLGASLTLQLHVSHNADPVKIHAGVVGWTIKGKYFGVKFVRVEATEQFVLHQYLSRLS
ncbi:PilZ domain-containing protein [Nitrospira sp. Nam74]